MMIINLFLKITASMSMLASDAHSCGRIQRSEAGSKKSETTSKPASSKPNRKAGCEVEGLQVSYTGVGDKIAQVDATMKRGSATTGPRNAWIRIDLGKDFHMITKLEFLFREACVYGPAWTDDYTGPSLHDGCDIRIICTQF